MVIIVKANKNRLLHIAGYLEQIKPHTIGKPRKLDRGEGRDERGIARRAGGRWERPKTKLLARASAIFVGSGFIKTV